VTRALYHFLWHDYCDWYVELAKDRLYGEAPEARQLVRQLLVEVLEQALRVMHPIMPYLTESLWQALPKAPGEQAVSIMVAEWPRARAADVDQAAEEEMELLQEMVTAARTIRGEMSIPPGRKIQLVLSTGNAELAGRLRGLQEYIGLLAGAESVEVGQGLAQPPASGSAVVRNVDVYVPLAGLVDLAVERQRLQKEIGKFQGLVRGMETKLGNEQFLSKAPAEVVEKERRRLEEYQAALASMASSLARLRT
jgi:valyl-tRNA synthetase